MKSADDEHGKSALSTECELQYDPANINESVREAVII